MNGKIVVGVSIGVVIGLILGILIGFILLPNFFGGTPLVDSDYTRITVFSDYAASAQFGDYNYLFFYKYDSYGGEVKASDGIVVGVGNKFEIVPSVIGSTNRILDLRIKVSEIHNDYVVLLVKLA